MLAHQVIILARKHLTNDAYALESARLCLSDANRIVEECGDLNAAKERALKSLAYSVGVFHPDYVRASK